MPPAPNLTVLTLSCAKLAKTQAFYKALGFKPGYADKDVAFFQMQGTVLSLYNAEALARDLKLTKKPVPGGINPAINLPSPKAVEAFYHKALKAGAKGIRAPHQAEWGGYTCYFSDPEGHPWELAWNPHWRLDKRGNLTM